ncbi:MAG: putative acetyltransferase [Nitrospira sp.]|nr:putative acetyltransferase [Nitrospira sp.]
MPKRTLPPVATLKAFPQLLPERCALLDADQESVILLAEFHGSRVDDIRQAQKHISAMLDLDVQFVRSGWMPLSEGGAVHHEQLTAKIKTLREQQQSCAGIEDGSFAVLPESSKDSFGYFGSFSKIRTPVEINYPSHISVGNWVSLGRYGKIVMLPGKVFDTSSEPYIAQHYPKLAGTYDFTDCEKDRPAQLYLGDGTTLGDRYFIICTKSVEFGKHVMTASNLFVSDCHHIYENTEIPPALLPVTAGKPVKIEDHVWIGINCCILEGVTIGRHAVVAANSVVKEDVPPYSLVAGTPAKVKKTFRPGENRYL